MPKPEREAVSTQGKTHDEIIADLKSRTKKADDNYKIEYRGCFITVNYIKRGFSVSYSTSISPQWRNDPEESLKDIDNYLTKPLIKAPFSYRVYEVNNNLMRAISWHNEEDDVWSEPDETYKGNLKASSMDKALELAVQKFNHRKGYHLEVTLNLPYGKRAPDHAH